MARERRWGWWIVLAYGVLAALWQVQQPIFWNPQLDGKENFVLAEALARGDWGGEPFYRAMLYPALLAGMRLIFGGDLLPLGALLLGLGAHWVTSACAAVLAQRIWRSDLAGTFALVLCGVNPVLLHFAFEPLDVTLGIALCLVGLCIAGLGEREAPGWGRVLTGGFFVGLAVLTRPHFLPVLAVLPVALALSLLGGQIPWRRGVLVWVSGGACLLSFGLASFAVGGEFRILPWQGAFNLYAANRDNANGKYFTQKLFLTDLREGENPARAEAEILYAQATGETPPFAIDAQNSFWRERFLEHASENPAQFAALQARKVYFLFNDFEQYNNKTFSYHKMRSPLLRWNPIGWGLLFVLAAGALVVCRPLHPALRGIALLAAAYAAGMGMYYISARFRIPLVPFLVIGASGWGAVIAAWVGYPFRSGADAEKEAVGRPPARISPSRWVGAAVLMVAAAALTFTPFFGARDTRTFIQDEMLLANAAAEGGFDAEAMHYAARALERDPARQDGLRIFLVSAFNVALTDSTLLEGRGGWQALLDAAERFQARDPAGFLVQGVVFWNNGQENRAVALWSEALHRFGPAAESSAKCLLLVGAAEGLGAPDLSSDPEAIALGQLLSQERR